HYWVLANRAPHKLAVQPAHDDECLFAAFRNPHAKGWDGAVPNHLPLTLRSGFHCLQAAICEHGFHDALPLGNIWGNAFWLSTRVIDCSLMLLKNSVITVAWAIFKPLNVRHR